MKDNIIKIAEQTGEILMKFYQTDLSVEYKKGDDYDPVTIADKEADNFIRSQLLELFPQDLILSEENEDIPTDYSKRIWMIDPLDGTKDFIKGNGGFAIHIGLWEGGSILFGLVYAPARDKLYFAEKDGGAFERQSDDSFKKINTSNVTDLRKARLITRTPGNDKRPLDKLIKRLPVSHILEEGGAKVARVATGEAEIHLNTNFRASKWDTLAPQLILEEAGGVMTDLDGQPLDYQQPGLRWERSYIAVNNKTMLDQIIAALSS